jgi:hypothetical protein
MRRGVLSVLAAAGVISIVTAVTRAGDLGVRALAATPDAVADGRVWLLVTSALVADRPALASILGLATVGVVAVTLCGKRVLWLAAASGHILSAAIVYGAIALARIADARDLESVMGYPDYGTSAIIAAWIGAIACVLWLRGRRAGAVALCVASALLGWYFKGTLTVLDTEHAFALAFGAAVTAYASRGAQPLRRAAGSARFALRP